MGKLNVARWRAVLLMVPLVLVACADNSSRGKVTGQPPEDAPPNFDLACMNDADKASLASKAPFREDDECKCIVADKRIWPIMSKLMLDPANVDPIMMVVSETPYKSDKKPLERNLRYRQQCHALRLSALGQANPAMASIYSARYANYEAVYRDLLTGTLSYGLANQRLRKIYLESEAQRTGKPVPQ